MKIVTGRRVAWLIWKSQCEGYAVTRVFILVITVVENGNCLDEACEEYSVTASGEMVVC